MGTTRISAEIREILIVQSPVTPKRADASGSKISDDVVSTFEQACSGRYSGSLKLSSRRFERAKNQSAPFLILFFDRTGSERFGAVTCGNTLKIWWKNHVFSTINRARTHSFSPGVNLDLATCTMLRATCEKYYS